MLTPSGSAIHAILDQALVDYNRAAETIGFTRCATLTDQRAKVLAKRLADLGQGDMARGAERFREALAAIPHWPFLAGKAPPRAGDKPFRLDLEGLLSTGGGLGDRLAKLLDLHDERGGANLTNVNSAIEDSRKRFELGALEAMDKHQADARARWDELADMEVLRDLH